MFIKNIARVLEGLIYILLGVVIAAIVIILFTLPTEDLAEEIEEITEGLIFTIFILQPLPTILKKYINSTNDNSLFKAVCVLKNIHISLGILLIGLRILHVEINFLFEPFSWNLEMITSMLLSIVLIPTVIYGILRINDSKKYRKLHRLFLALTYIIFFIHLFH